MNEYRYKFLRLSDDNAIRSDSGDCTWTPKVWQSVDEVVMCESGFHCSRHIYQAFTYVQGEILAEVEVDGDSIINDDKETWQKMRIVCAWKWRKEDSVSLAAFAAELVLDNYEKQYPGDMRPRDAIEAAKAWINAPIEDQSAARSAAESAARSAARSAESAWSAACSAARSAAWSAACSAARSAAWSAAESAIIEKISQWMDERVAVLEVLA